MKFQFPIALLLFPVIMAAVRFLSGKRRKAYQTYTGPFDTGPSPSGAVRRLPELLLWLGIALLCVALARPRKGFERLPRAGEGLDIVITLDVSSSMDQDDYYPTRLKAAKDAALAFIRGRPNDRLGLVIYAGEPRTLCPPTFDHGMVERCITKAKRGSIPDGTAIGAGLAAAARGLDYSRTSRRVIVLISDGEDTSGKVDPITVAKAVHVIHGDSLKVYTVAIGTPSRDEGLGVDRATLDSIARINGGMLFDADSPEALQRVYASIDSLEASTLPEEGLFVYRDSYMTYLVLGMILVLGASVLYYRRLKVVGE